MGKHPSTGLPICRPVRPAAVPVISRRWYHNTLTGDARLVSVSAILERMIDKRPQADRLLIAQMTGEAGHRAKWGELNEPLKRQAADLCRKADADPKTIPAWIAEGRRRAAAARQPPFSGGLHGGGALP